MFGNSMYYYPYQDLCPQLSSRKTTMPVVVLQTDAGPESLPFIPNGGEISWTVMSE